MKAWRALRPWIVLALLMAAGVYSVNSILLAPEPVPVRIRPVERGTVEETVSNTRAGSVRSRASADLGVEMPGTVVQIHRREGAAVNKGDPLLSLDARQAAAALALAEKQLAMAEAQLADLVLWRDHTARELKRKEELYRKPEKPISEAEVDRVRTEHESFGARVREAEARVELQKQAVARARLDLEKHTLRSPFRGVVAHVWVEEGEWAVPGKPALRLIDLSRLYVRAEIDEVDMGRLKPGLPVRIRFDPFRDRKFTGRVTRVGDDVSEIELQNRTVEIEVEADDPIAEIGLRPGTSADVEVILQRKQGVLRIPRMALMEGQRVLLLRNGRTEAVKIQTGIKNWDFVEVVSGLAEGDPVVVNLENDLVKEGVAAVIASEGAPAP